MYESRIADLESDLASRENQFREALAAKDAEVKELRQQMADQLMEYHELMDIKLALDMEIGNDDSSSVRWGYPNYPTPTSYRMPHIRK